MNKIETVTQSRDKLHISVNKLISKLQSAGITVFTPNCSDYNKIVTLDISYFDGLTKISLHSNKVSLNQ